MFYTIYKITNLINGKIYIGKHKTNDIHDGYMGSGKLLGAAIKKYGVENFRKEILHIFESEDEMNIKESEIVSPAFVALESNYNLCPGGHGGFGYINDSGLNVSGKLHKSRIETDPSYREAASLWSKKGADTIKRLLQTDSEFSRRRSDKISQKVKSYYQNNGSHWTGQKHRDETRKLISEKSKGKGAGEKNSQFGSQWITNGIINQKISKEVQIPTGWRKGRITNNKKIAR